MKMADQTCSSSRSSQLTAQQSTPGSGPVSRCIDGIGCVWQATRPTRDWHLSRNSGSGSPTWLHCDKALSTIGSMEKHHHHSHPNQPLPDTWSQCHFQHLWSLNEPYQPSDHLLTTILNDDHQHLHFTWGSGPLRCMACTSPLGLMGFYLGCHLWKVASLLTLDARTLLCGLQNLPHLLSMWSNLWKNMRRTINQYFSSISNPKFRLWLFKPHKI